jgi:hypothetical protein
LVEEVARGDPGWDRLLARFPSYFLTPETRMVNPEVLTFRRRFLWAGIIATPSGQLMVEDDRYGSRVAHTGLGWSPGWRVNHNFVAEELPPATVAEAARWEANRREAYRGSIPHFLRALMHRRLAGEGFDVLNPEAFQCLLRIDKSRFMLVAWPRLDVRYAGSPTVHTIRLHIGVLVVDSNGMAGGS